ncbi:MAG TPA: HNH endonuclease [Candidatus Saccharimonadales bacterium]|jgi:5-methylcytosine-specific restriction endonuclease McrA|nr:HNH endonuclease [Candidatus Saccharimonadales bacterium]
MEYNLPTPESNEFTSLIRGTSERGIYAVLYANLEKHLSMAEIRQQMGLESGQQEHLNRRMRELYSTFEIERIREGNETKYKLIKKLDKQLNTEQISNRVRSWVLRDKRCVQCGRTPAEDGVKLHVDHKIPQAWGGTNDPENLQALCSDCNEGKKNLYATYDDFADKIKLAATYNEPHKRIGELLKAFNGKPVPSDLVELVAKAKQYQDDWQKRMRELRELGWEYSFIKKKEDNRFKTYFVLEHFEPWPDGSVRAAIRQREQLKKQK